MNSIDTRDIQHEARRESFSRGRSWNIGFHVVVSTLALLAVLGMLNYLAHRHNQRFYLRNSNRFKLTPLTLQVLSSVTNNVKAIVFFDRREPLFSAVSGLLREYQVRCPKLDVEFVDYRLPGRAAAIRAQYKLAADSDTSRIIFDSGSEVRTVLSTELSDYAMTPNKEIVRNGFRGEQLFTSAILNVTQNQPVTGLFLQGHGEHRLTDDNQGYSLFGKLLENNNVSLRPAPPLLGTNSIPAECGLIVIAGPTRPFETEELVKLDQYLSRGGRLFVLMKGMGSLAPTGLEQLLYKWNVQVGFDWIQDTAQAQSNDPNIIVSSSFGSHPIVRSLLRSSVKLIAPRSVRQRPLPPTSPDAAKVTELFFTGTSGRELIPNDNNTWSVLTNKTQIPLAVAGERGGVQGVKTEKGATRFVVAGDSLFLSNAVFNDAANSDFANAAINWLASRDSLLNEIGPSPVSEYQITLTEQQMSQLRMLFLGAIPGAVIVIGFFVWLRRRV